MRTGVFFHEIFARQIGPIIGDKFARFPQMIADELAQPNVTLYTPKPADLEWVGRIHSERFIVSVQTMWYYERAMVSIGGLIEASERIHLDEIDNALVFDSAAGHHAHPEYAWGGTYINLIGPTVAYMRERHGVRRFAILDTDSHHGDGDREVFYRDEEVLHVCLCGSDHIEGNGTKVDVNVGWTTTDESYLSHIATEFVPRVRAFKPAMIYHLIGHDAARGDYGDRGLSLKSFVEMARLVKGAADEVCDGHYLGITHGGSRRDISEWVYPRVLRVLAGLPV